MTYCLIQQSAFGTPFWIGIRACIRLCKISNLFLYPDPSSQHVHIALLTSFRRLTEEGKQYIDELLPLLAHFTRLYLLVKPSGSETQIIRSLLIDCLCELIIQGFIDPAPLKSLILQSPSTLEEEQECLKWIETCLPLPRFVREITRLCWTLTTSSHSSIASEAYSLLLTLPSSELASLLTDFTNSSDTASLIDLLVMRIEETGIEDNRLNGLVQLTCILEEREPIERNQSTSDTKPIQVIEEKKQLRESLWNDENQIFNNYSTVLDILVPLGYYSPNPSDQGCSAHYER